ncbi:RNA recognition motif-containing protein [Besnoitia besnoiti]|uniref:RNA recognition motif-containing protein n=1 Tax=Besnoitia besnoiti TaxID=94643 RepID=A0A2A9M1K7_BESBE|nr:RNA recognition motif-containing protein [Besnoitia besnoiti]PFH32378.1 RNA recognition motif-containing protein [Besnoitia besnoiti]
MTGSTAPAGSAMTAASFPPPRAAVLAGEPSLLTQQGRQLSSSPESATPAPSSSGGSASMCGSSPSPEHPSLSSSLPSSPNPAVMSSPSAEGGEAASAGSGGSQSLYSSPSPSASSAGASAVSSPPLANGFATSASSPSPSPPTVRRPFGCSGSSLSAAGAREQEGGGGDVERAGARGGVSSAQGARGGERSTVYGGLHASLFPPLSAATAPPPRAPGAAAGAVANAQTASELIGGPPSLWEVYWTPDTKLPYFYNAITKHVQWQRPLPPKEYVDRLGNPDIPDLSSAPTPFPPGGVSGGGRSGAVLYGPLGSNLFVYHIPPEWTEQQFFRHFAPFGNVISCKIQTNSQTGKRSGFGFVSYDNQASAIAAIRAMNGYAACGKFLKVQLKKGEEHLLPPDLAAQQTFAPHSSSSSGSGAHPSHA